MNASRRIWCYLLNLQVLPAIALAGYVWTLPPPMEDGYSFTNEALGTLWEASEAIVVGYVQNNDLRNRIVVGVKEVLKGSCLERSIEFDASGDVRGDWRELAALLKDVNKESPVILFFCGRNGVSWTGEDVDGMLYIDIGTFVEKGVDNAFPIFFKTLGGKKVVTQLHLHGCWMGGPEMLVEAMKYIRAVGKEEVCPPMPLTKWMQTGEIIAGIGSNVTEMSAVDAYGDGHLFCHLGTESGDTLFRAADGPRSGLAEVTMEKGLKSSSRFCCWADLTGDGRVDLIACDGNEMTLQEQTEKGTFQAKKLVGDTTVPAECLGISVIGLDDRSCLAIVVHADEPYILTLSDGRQLQKRTLPKADKSVLRRCGKVRGGEVGDFTNDGYPDIIQICQHDGLFYKGGAKGAFSAPTLCKAACEGPVANIVSGDFNCDGWLDLLIRGYHAEREKMIYLYQNRKNEMFSNEAWHSGMIDVLADEQQMFDWGIKGLALGDYNNDGLDDVVSLLARGGSLCSVGFRTFLCDWEARVQNKSDNDIHVLPHKCLLADMNDDGALDLLAVRTEGGLIYAINELKADRRLSMKVVLGRDLYSYDPVKVSCTYGKHHPLGARLARASLPAFFGCPRSGDYTLEWQLPGGAVQKAVVRVEDRPLRVLLGRNGVSVDALRGGVSKQENSASKPDAK